MDLNLLKTLVASFAISVGAGFAAYHFMLEFIPLFIQRRLCGADQCKKERGLVAEPMGVIAAAIYLISVLIFLPIQFHEWINESLAENLNVNVVCQCVEHIRLSSLLAACVSICLAILLGFGDDILDLRWRHKLIFPTLSAMPLLLVYHFSKSSTSMLLPPFAAKLFGATFINLGIFFYIFLMMLVIFCTNAINIIAGINGVEVGQSVVIALSVAVFNIIQIFRLEPLAVWPHVLSLCILMPFISTSFALYQLNKYPAKCFVGDTYCYWAGMTLAVVAVLGGFSKTLLLFLIPQILNFIYSVPQLFHFIPCPRHRLPRFNPDTQLLHISVAEFEPAKLKGLGRKCYALLRFTRLIQWREFEKDGATWAEINNLTILNFLLKCFGPMHEWKLTNLLLVVQLAFSVFAFFCRFYLAQLLYSTVH